MSVKIVTDSTCDLPAEKVAEHGITVVPLFINIGDRGYLDGVELSRQDFYDQLPYYESQPTTAAPGPELFRRTYLRLVDEGATEILSIHIASALSATVGVARMGAEGMDAVPVSVLDSRQLSLGTGFLVLAAARASEEGRPTPEIVALLEEQIARTHVFAVLDTLEFLRRSGRMNSVMATLGGLLQIKPLLKMYDGNATAERLRTRAKAMDRMLNELRALAPLEQAALLHAHAPDRAEDLKRRVQHLLPEGHLPSVEITPAIGAHIGPGAVGFACVSAGWQ